MILSLPQPCHFFNRVGVTDHRCRFVFSSDVVVGVVLFAVIVHCTSF